MSLPCSRLPHFTVQSFLSTLAREHQRLKYERAQDRLVAAVVARLFDFLCFAC
jgi:hypothetical protein